MNIVSMTALSGVGVAFSAGAAGGGTGWAEAPALKIKAAFIAAITIKDLLSHGLIILSSLSATDAVAAGILPPSLQIGGHD
jgi:hypothetical protein